MKPERWELIEKLYQAVVERPPGERTAFLEEACRGDEELRRELESLLAHRERAASFMAAPVVERPGAFGGDSVGALGGEEGSMVGTTIAHYNVLEQLGKGGMGEVWKARDTKLGREVAIKTLPEDFAKDAERLSRLQREARLLASLNHPNIATIHGLEERGGTPFLVLELVEGDTLADRLKHGAIPVEESLQLALQLAEALEAAHGKGVIHRDLKPANIKVTPDGKVKVLDFGLAKASGRDGADVNLSQSPALSAATQPGVILGTAAYMSPEQAKGQEVDKRTDIWAFGCVLYEMLTARRPFPGETLSDTVAKILESGPDWNSLPANTHARIRELLERCLDKDVKARWHDIADVRVDIQRVLADPSGVIVRPGADELQAPQRPMPRWAGAVALAAIVAVIATLNLQPDAPTPTLVRFSHPLPDGQAFTATSPQTTRPLIDVSPDGSTIVYAANGQLWIRNLGSEEVRPVSGTQENSRHPIFSPDGEWVAYWADGQLKKVQIAGGTPVVLCDATNPTGWDWAGNTVFFGQGDRGIMRVSSNGGTPEVVVAEGGWGPRMLPGGEVLMFHRMSAESSSGFQIWAQSLETGEETLLVEDGRAQGYASTGHLIYFLDAAIFAVPFDVQNLAVSGGSVSVIENVSRLEIPQSVPHFGLSDNGTVAYISSEIASLERSLVWVDRDGSNAVPLGADLADYGLPRISPDGTKVAVEILARGGRHIWVYDLESGSWSQFTFEGSSRVGGDRGPVWTRDGSRIAFMSDLQPTNDIYWKLADGSGETELLLERESHLIPTSWSPDDDVLAFYIIDPETHRDIWTLQIDDGTAEPEPFLVGPADERAPAFSPGGNWIAYVSDEMERDEVWVKPYPSTAGGQKRISTESGVEPIWSPDGRELFFRTTEGNMMAVEVDASAGFTFQPPRKLFDGQMYMNFEDPTQRGIQTYDVHPDGDRFLMVTEPQKQVSQQIHVVVNWFEELKERVPVP